MVAKLRELLRENSMSCRDRDLGGVKSRSGGNSETKTEVLKKQMKGGWDERATAEVLVAPQLGTLEP